jgi:hypothetical protein
MIWLMASAPLTSQQLTTDRIVAIVFMCLGVLLEIIWFVPSLMTIMAAASATTAPQQFGIALMIIGPIVAVVALAVTTIVLLALKRRAMIAGIFTLVAPIAVVVLGLALLFPGG